MTDESAALLTASAFVVGLMAAICLLAAVFWGGGTFGQRCAAAFPGDGLAQERCVYHLSHEIPL